MQFQSRIWYCNNENHILTKTNFFCLNYLNSANMLEFIEILVFLITAGSLIFIFFILDYLPIMRDKKD